MFDLPHGRGRHVVEFSVVPVQVEPQEVLIGNCLDDNGVLVEVQGPEMFELRKVRHRAGDDHEPVVHVAGEEERGCELGNVEGVLPSPFETANA